MADYGMLILIHNCIHQLCPAFELERWPTWVKGDQLFEYTAIPVCIVRVLDGYSGVFSLLRLLCKAVSRSSSILCK